MKAPLLIHEARRRAGLTQQQLAERLGTTQSVVARWEAGKRSPSLETIEQIANACDLEVSISLVPHDNHDLRLALGMKHLSPGQRIEALVDAQRKLDKLTRRARRVDHG
ncbi:MAG: helix-turn-helix transcriptional regulator [Actinomycetota bacterium]